jgi:anaerobic magnesium-protoporphyrin IX monomethyl ester cyclase
MKITFAYLCPFNNTGIPIGLSYLIAILKNKGHEVTLFETTFYDFDYSAFNITGVIDEKGNRIIGDFKAYIEETKPGLIAVSCTSLCLSFASKILESLDEEVKTIFGGVGATTDYKNLINNETVDYICVGFGEECLPKLIECLNGRGNLKEVPNLVYKEDKAIIKNDFLQNIDLSKLPAPDWSLFDPRHFERIFKGINSYLHAEIKTGIYRFPIRQIIETIKSLSREYRLDIVRIFDECFGFGKPEYYEEFAKLYKKEIGLPTIIETRPETITAETIGILKEIGCISVSIGVEAGNEGQRRTLLNRTVSNDSIRNAFTLLHKAKIRTASYNIIGFPDDTREKIFETIKLNKECMPDFINAFLFCPFPGTQLREYCLKNNLLETTAVVDYGIKSVIKNKNMDKKDLLGLFRTFGYYVKLPKYLYPLIERAEEPDRIGNIIFRLLSRF